MAWSSPRFSPWPSRGARLARPTPSDTFAGGGLPVNIPGTSASLHAPVAVAVDAQATSFSRIGNAVLRLDATTGVLTLVAGNGTPGYSGDNGPATSAQLKAPTGVAVDAAGNLYIADSVTIASARSRMG